MTKEEAAEIILAGPLACLNCQGRGQLEHVVNGMTLWTVCGHCWMGKLYTLKWKEACKLLGMPCADWVFPPTEDDLTLDSLHYALQTLEEK
jgi:hypothetical protein